MPGSCCSGCCYMTSKLVVPAVYYQPEVWKPLTPGAVWGLKYGYLLLLSHSKGLLCQSPQVQVWDTAGQERFRKSMVEHYYRNVHAVVFVYDVTKMASFRNLQTWIEVGNYQFITKQLNNHVSVERIERTSYNKSTCTIKSQYSCFFCGVMGNMACSSSVKFANTAFWRFYTVNFEHG